MLICKSCCLSKNEDDFPKSSRSTSGRNPNCKICINQINKEYRLANVEKVKLARRKHYRQNRDKLLEQKSAYAKTHKLQKAEYDKTYRQVNVQKFKDAKRRFELRNRDNPIFKIKRNLRRRIHHVLKNNTKSKSTLCLLGCTFEEFKLHIEKQWSDGMSWNNYGQYGWHIDHIIPCYKFDLSKPEEQAKCFHYSNQRPLWLKDNLSRPRD